MKAPILWCLSPIGLGLYLTAIATAQQTAQFLPRNGASQFNATTSQPRAATSNSEAQVAARGTTAVSQDLLAIYQQTRTVADEAGVTAIARACSKVIPDNARSRADRDYAASLFAWALNRRGEMRNEQAAELVEQGQVDQASSLDIKAAKDFETALQYNDKNWRIHHNLAISLAMKGDYVRAIKEFSAAIDLNPEYPNSYFNRGELYFELAQYPQAMDDYTQAIALNATDPQYHNSRGHCRFMLQDFDAALADYQQACELGADSAVYATDMADAYQFLGRWEQATQSYRAAVAINAKYPRAYQNAAWLMATCPDPKYRNVDLSLSAAKKVIELTGERSSAALDTLAAATAAMGKHREATELQQEAIGLASQDERAELQQRLALYRQGESFVQPTQVTNIAATSSSTSSRIRTASGSRR